MPTHNPLLWPLAGVAGCIGVVRFNFLAFFMFLLLLSLPERDGATFTGRDDGVLSLRFFHFHFLCYPLFASLLET